jgi:hypothetical protein
MADSQSIEACRRSVLDSDDVVAEGYCGRLVRIEADDAGRQVGGGVGGAGAWRLERVHPEAWLRICGADGSMHVVGHASPVNPIYVVDAGIDGLCEPITEDVIEGRAARPVGHNLWGNQAPAAHGSLLPSMRTSRHESNIRAHGVHGTANTAAHLDPSVWAAQLVWNGDSHRCPRRVEVSLVQHRHRLYPVLLQAPHLDGVQAMPCPQDGVPCTQFWYWQDCFCAAARPTHAAKACVEMLDPVFHAPAAHEAC